MPKLSDQSLRRTIITLITIGTLISAIMGNILGVVTATCLLIIPMGGYELNYVMMERNRRNSAHPARDTTPLYSDCPRMDI